MCIFSHWSIEKSLLHNLQEPNSFGGDNREESETPDVNEEDGEREVLWIDLVYKCNMVICFFIWLLIQNHFPQKMHWRRVDLFVWFFSLSFIQNHIAFHTKCTGAGGWDRPAGVLNKNYCQRFGFGLQSWFLKDLALFFREGVPPLQALLLLIWPQCHLTKRKSQYCILFMTACSTCPR